MAAECCGAWRCVPQSALAMSEQLLQTRGEFLATCTCPLDSQSRPEGLTPESSPLCLGTGTFSLKEVPSSSLLRLTALGYMVMEMS